MDMETILKGTDGPKVFSSNRMKIDGVLGRTSQ